MDGVLKHTGTTWENNYRYDSEQAGNQNAIPTTSKLLFAARGAPVLSVMQNQGYLIDEVSLSSSTTAPAITPPKVEGVAYKGNSPRSPTTRSLRTPRLRAPGLGTPR